MSHSERRHEAAYLDQLPDGTEFTSDAKRIAHDHKARKLIEEQAAMYRNIR